MMLNVAECVHPLMLSVACYLASTWHRKWVIVWCAAGVPAGNTKVNKSWQLRQKSVNNAIEM